jgi:hypothetical protein
LELKEKRKRWLLRTIGAKFSAILHSPERKKARERERKKAGEFLKKNGRWDKTEMPEAYT